MPVCAFFPDFIRVYDFKLRLLFHSDINRRRDGKKSLYTSRRVGRAEDAQDSREGEKSFSGNVGDRAGEEKTKIAVWPQAVAR